LEPIEYVYGSVDGHQFFPNRIVDIRNSLPAAVVLSPSAAVFKRNQSINQAFIAGSMAHKNTHRKKTKKKGTHTHAQLQTTNLYKKGN